MKTKQHTKRQTPRPRTAPLLLAAALVLPAACYQRTVSSKSGIYGGDLGTTKEGNLKSGRDAKGLDKAGNFVFGDPGKDKPRN